jgi:hypothetical protein
MLGGLSSGVFGLLVLVGIFWLCRELFCWYWKFSRMVELAENQRAELVAIKGLLRQLVDQGRGQGKAEPAADPE